MVVAVAAVEVVLVVLPADLVAAGVAVAVIGSRAEADDVVAAVAVDGVVAGAGDDHVGVAGAVDLVVVAVTQDRGPVPVAVVSAAPAATQGDGGERDQRCGQSQRDGEAPMAKFPRRPHVAPSRPRPQPAAAHRLADPTPDGATLLEHAPARE